MANSFVRNSVVNAVAGVFTTFGGFLGTILVARLLGVSGTGVVAFATWAVTVAVILSDLGLTGCLPRFLPELLASGDITGAERLSYSLYRSFLVSITSIALCFALYAIWLALSDPSSLRLFVSSNGYATSPVFWVLVGCAGFIQGLGNFCTGWIKGLQDFGMLARVALAGCLAQTLATSLGATFFGVTGALASLAFGALMPALVLLRLPRRRGPISAPLRERVLRFSLETWGGYVLSAFFASRMEVFFLERSWGSHAVGLFTVSLTMSNLATQGPVLLTGALLPRLSDHLGRNEAEEARRVYETSVSLMGFLVFPACLGTAAIVPTLLPLMYGEAFSSAVPTATILLTASALGATASVASIYLIAVERTRFLLGTTVVGAALSIVAGLTIVPAFGPVAAAFGRGGIQILLAGAVLLYMYRDLQCPTPVGILLKLLTAAAICAVAARLVVAEIPAGYGVALAVVAGALSYATAIRLLNPLPSHIVDKLRSVVMTLPRALRPAANVGLQMMCS